MSTLAGTPSDPHVSAELRHLLSWKVAASLLAHYPGSLRVVERESVPQADCLTLAERKSHGGDGGLIDLNRNGSAHFLRQPEVAPWLHFWQDVTAVDGMAHILSRLATTAGLRLRSDDTQLRRGPSALVPRVLAAVLGARALEGDLVRCNAAGIYSATCGYYEQSWLSSFPRAAGPAEAIWAITVNEAPRLAIDAQGTLHHLQGQSQQVRPEVGFGLDWGRIFAALQGDGG